MILSFPEINEIKSEKRSFSDISFQFVTENAGSDCLLLFHFRLLTKYVASPATTMITTIAIAA